jgi:hypothetical protein
MNCPDVRRAVLHNSDALDPAVLEHARECAECAAALRYQRAFNDSLKTALRVDVPSDLAERIISAQAVRAPRRHTFRRYLALAASLMMVTLVIAVVATPSPSLASQIARHVEKERLREDTPDTAPQSDLAESARFFDISIIRALPVSRTSVCLMGRWLGLHFVLDGSGGPVEVVVVPGVSIIKATSIDAGPLHGRLVPENGYALAVLNSIGTSSDDDIRNIQKAIVLPQESSGSIRSAMKSAATWANFIVLAIKYKLAY